MEFLVPKIKRLQAWRPKVNMFLGGERRSTLVAGPELSALRPAAAVPRRAAAFTCGTKDAVRWWRGRSFPVAIGTTQPHPQQSTLPGARPQKSNTA